MRIMALKMLLDSHWRHLCADGAGIMEMMRCRSRVIEVARPTRLRDDLQSGEGSRAYKFGLLHFEAHRHPLLPSPGPVYSVSSLLTQGRSTVSDFGLLICLSC